MCVCILSYFDIDLYVLRAGVSVNAGSGGEEMEEILYVWRLWGETADHAGRSYLWVLQWGFVPRVGARPSRAGS